LQSRFRQGLALHRQGDLVAAERIYQEILDSEPSHFDALHMLGLVSARAALMGRMAPIAIARAAIRIEFRARMT
jgi:protein O-GlcNAc transferase